MPFTSVNEPFSLLLELPTARAEFSPAAEPAPGIVTVDAANLRSPVCWEDAADEDDEDEDDDDLEFIDDDEEDFDDEEDDVLIDDDFSDEEGEDLDDDEEEDEDDEEIADRNSRGVLLLHE